MSVAASQKSELNLLDIEHVNGRKPPDKVEFTVGLVTYLICMNPCSMPGAGPSLRRWFRDVADGVGNSSFVKQSTQGNESLSTGLVQEYQKLLHIRTSYRLDPFGSILDSAIHAIAWFFFAMESAEEELLDLFTSHRSETYLN